MNKISLILQDGTTYEGFSFGSQKDVIGEVVFNTSMTGYQEIYTDPSYFGQIIINTSSHIGNYGTIDNEPLFTLPTKIISNTAAPKALLLPDV